MTRRASSLAPTSFSHVHARTRDGQRRREGAPHPLRDRDGCGAYRGRSRGRTPTSPHRAHVRAREGTTGSRVPHPADSLDRRGTCSGGSATRRAESPGRQRRTQPTSKQSRGSLRNSAERHHDERPRLNRHYASPPCRPARRGASGRGRHDVDTSIGLLFGSPAPSSTRLCGFRLRRRGMRWPTRRRARR